MMSRLCLVAYVVYFVMLLSPASAFSVRPSVMIPKVPSQFKLYMAVNNDAFARANRAARSVGASDRVVEILLPLGMELDEGAQNIVSFCSCFKVVNQYYILLTIKSFTPHSQIPKEMCL